MNLPINYTKGLEFKMSLSCGALHSRTWLYTELLLPATLDEHLLLHRILHEKVNNLPKAPNHAQSWSALHITSTNKQMTTDRSMPNLKPHHRLYQPQSPCPRNLCILGPHFGQQGRSAAMETCLVGSHYNLLFLWVTKFQIKYLLLRPDQIFT